MEKTADIQSYQLKKFLKLIASVSTFLSLQSCDKVVNDVPIDPQPIIPQATTEVFKQMYPEVSSFIFKPLEQNKTWQTNFAASSGKVLSLVDYQGEIIDLNQLVGLPKPLPNAVKQHLLANYPTADIVEVYENMKSSTVTDGFKVAVKDKNNKLNIYYDANNNFIREEIAVLDKVSSIVFTSTDQINFDTSIPIVIKQFISNNQLKSANVIIYTLSDNSFKLVMDYREKINGALQTSEITLTQLGQITSWFSSIEQEFSYKVMTVSDLPVSIADFLKSRISNWQFDYGATETAFGKNKTHYVTVKSGTQDNYLLVKNENESNLSVTYAKVLTDAELPQTVKNIITDNFANWAFSKARVVFAPVIQPSTQLNNNPKYYHIELKQGIDNYVIRINNDGKVMFKYKVQ